MDVKLWCFKLSVIAILFFELQSCSTKEKISVNQEESDDQWIEFDLNFAKNQYSNFTSSLTAPSYPGSLDKNGNLRTVTESSWMSGFFPGSLWYLYEYTFDEKWKNLAIEWTKPLEQQKNNTGTHDVGFIINCSFGNWNRLIENPECCSIIVDAANSLAYRYNKKIQCIKSWDFSGGPDKWKQFPVIIDNMMNLELLYNAAKITGDTVFSTIATNHATKTMENHFRDDYGSYHVVDYDTTTGAPIKRMTFQGYSDESTWARGQAWGIYGFTVCYRETGDEKFLNTASRLADYYIHHENLPEDKIPFWDFNAPEIPNVYKDVSAASITASALIELAQFKDCAKSNEYMEFAINSLQSLSSDKYLSTNSAHNFLLNHATGNKPFNHQIDVPLNYADYYFIEALVRLSKYKKNI